MTVRDLKQFLSDYQIDDDAILRVYNLDSRPDGDGYEIYLNVIDLENLNINSYCETSKTFLINFKNS